MPRRLRLAAVLLLTAPLLLRVEAASAADFDAAVGLYRQNKVAEAEAGYRAVLADPATTPDDKARAHRELARVAWLIDGDAGRALAAVAAGEATGAEVCDTAALHVRILGEAGRPAEGSEAAARLLPACDDPAEADELRRLLIAALADQAAAGGGDRATLLTRAQAEAGALSADAATNLDIQRTLLDLALQRGDAGAALSAWRAYFWLTEADAPQALHAEAGRIAPIFRAGLAPGAPAVDQLAVVALLNRAGFTDASRRFAGLAQLAERAGQDPAWKKARAWFAFIDTVRSEGQRHNRALARGRREGNYEKAIVAALATLTGEREPAKLKATMQRDYGVYGTVGETSGYPSMHAGHIVQDEVREVAQYGRKGSMRFVVIDNEFANGFESWLWDGWAAAGGWGEDGGTIIQIRPRYTGGPLRALALVGDTPQRARALARIAAQEPADLVKARGPGVPYLPSVNGRLNLQVADQIAARARARASAGDFRTAFLAEYWAVSIGQSIFDHEGRHVLDQAAKKEIGKLSTEAMEYRAKLSELTLGEVPKFSLGTIYIELVGADTPHGRANRRIVGELAKWAAAHPGEVAGYDPALPALYQLDKLSDAQIAAVARGLDPWAE